MQKCGDRSSAPRWKWFQSPHAAVSSVSWHYHVHQWVITQHQLKVTTSLSCCDCQVTVLEVATSQWQYVNLLWKQWTRNGPDNHTSVLANQCSSLQVTDANTCSKCLSEQNDWLHQTWDGDVSSRLAKDGMAWWRWWRWWTADCVWRHKTRRITWLRADNCHCCHWRHVTAFRWRRATRHADVTAPTDVIVVVIRWWGFLCKTSSWCHDKHNWSTIQQKCFHFRVVHQQSLSVITVFYFESKDKLRFSAFDCEAATA